MIIVNVNYITPGSTSDNQFPKNVSFNTSDGNYHIQALSTMLIHLYFGAPENDGSNIIVGNKKFLIFTQLVDGLVERNESSLATLLLGSEIFNTSSPLDPDEPDEAEDMELPSSSF